MIATYDYPMNGIYSETIATLPDGRMYRICTQYKVVSPCKGFTLDGVDQAALLAEAKIHGKFGPRPEPVAQPEAELPEWRSPRGLTLSEEMDREDTIY